MGRPRIYNNPEQIKLRAEASVKEQLKAKARALGMTFSQLLLLGALAFEPVAAVALPEPPPQESHAELQRSTTTTELSVLPEGAGQGSDLRAPLSLPAPHETTGEVVECGAPPVLDVEQAPLTTATPNQLTQSSELWNGLAPRLMERVTAQNFDIWLSAVSFLRLDGGRLVLQCPNAFFQEYLTEHYTEVIREELLLKHKKHYEIEFVARPALPEVEKPAPVAPEPTETDPEILELLRRDRELKEIDSSTRSITIANERREISQQLHRRRMAEAAAKKRAFDPDPEKQPSPKEIRAVAAELQPTPKNRNDHPWRKVTPKRPK